MKSRANIKGHPLHPILVSFPVAFFTGTLVFDVLGVIYAKYAFTETALYLEIAGLCSALAAAVPGLIDFIFTVPPKSTGKKRAAKHGLTNLTVVLFFAAALFCRLNTTISLFIIIGLEFIGGILLGFAGWLGGTLVSRNQIGIDIRYAGAGKWKEEYLYAADGEVEINDAGDIKTNQMKLVIVNGTRIVIANTENGYMAFSDHCTHRGGSLAGGAIICGTVQCPWHGSQFNVKTGDVKAGPATEKIPVYPLQEKNGKLYLTIHQLSNPSIIN
jgi:nitrite reductase/ring-hydroxylating ferredoxin subunit/uncharacterized membrane protein